MILEQLTEIKQKRRELEDMKLALDRERQEMVQQAQHKNFSPDESVANMLLHGAELTSASTAGMVKTQRDILLAGGDLHSQRAFDEKNSVIRKLAPQNRHTLI